MCCTARLETASPTFKQKQPSFTHAHTLVNMKTQTMLIVSYLSSRQFTGYRISAKLILSSISKYRECLHRSWRSQLDERNAIPSIPRAPPIELYTNCCSPRDRLQVLKIIFAMKETNVENHCCFVSFGRILCSNGRVRFIALQNHGVEHRCYIDGALVSPIVNPIATPHVPRQRSRIGFL